MSNLFGYYVSIIVLGVGFFFLQDCGRIASCYITYNGYSDKSTLWAERLWAPDNPITSDASIDVLIEAAKKLECPLSSYGKDQAR